MRLPTVRSVWPGRAVAPGRDAEQPPTVDVAQPPTTFEAPETMESRSRSALGRQILALVRGGGPIPSPRRTSTEDVESPKTPQFPLGMSNLPTPEPQQHRLSRTSTGSLGTTGSQRPTAPATPPPAQPPSGTSIPIIVTEPPPAATATDLPERATASRISEGYPGLEHRNVPTQEAYAQSAAGGGQNRPPAGTEEGQSRRKRWMRSPKIRSQVSRCIASAILLLAALAVCKCNRLR
jgi:hypothetical protein